jgi:hypothetical protein
MSAASIRAPTFCNEPGVLGTLPQEAIRKLVPDVCKGESANCLAFLISTRAHPRVSSEWEPYLRKAIREQIVRTVNLLR